MTLHTIEIGNLREEKARQEERAREIEKLSQKYQELNLAELGILYNKRVGGMSEFDSRAGYKPIPQNREDLIGAIADMSIKIDELSEKRIELHTRLLSRAIGETI